ncbi:MAG TPA: hydroxysqualene dehydroxylase HpnE [Ignavibacteria bacterium]|nr:hydroxysqualene dehydroxylase HpnE [Ignavibacteria bacterium]
MSKKKVVIIGGGLAGLASAVFLKEADKNNLLDITLYESSPKLGGRAYSFIDKKTGEFFDNGQHILAGWYKNTFDYLKLIGTYDKISFQKSLEVNFIDADSRVLKLKCPNLPAPLDLIAGLRRFDGFTKEDRKSLRALLKLVTLKPSGKNALELLRSFNQTDNLIKYFWEPFIYAVFNTKAENVGDIAFIGIMKKGFLKPGNSRLAIPSTNLNELFIDNAKKYFDQNGVTYNCGNKIAGINLSNNTVTHISDSKGNIIEADYFISAVPFFRVNELFPPESNIAFGGRLKPSSITSIHIFTETAIPETLLADNSFGMTGLIGRTVQWIFKRNSKHLSLVISGSDYLEDGQGETLTDIEAEAIYNIAYDDLCKSIDGFDKLGIAGYKVIKEKRATFIPDNDSENYRLPMETEYENLFLAGDWTDTGYPATIEGAITSGRKCADKVIKIISGS